jgi:hypothetical protein
MKRLLLGAALVALVGSAMAADVGVSVSIGQPGFYGRIDIGNAPQPRLIYSAPLIIQQGPAVMYRQPIYLRVPPGHEKHWDKNCRKYNACGQPVYFVQDSWYRNEYMDRNRRDQGSRGDNNGYGDRDDNRGNNGNHGRGHDKFKKNKGHGND